MVVCEREGFSLLSFFPFFFVLVCFGLFILFLLLFFVCCIAFVVCFFFFLSLCVCCLVGWFVSFFSLLGVCGVFVWFIWGEGVCKNTFPCCVVICVFIPFCYSVFISLLNFIM